MIERDVSDGVSPYLGYLGIAWGTISILLLQMIGCTTGPEGGVHEDESGQRRVYISVDGDVGAASIPQPDSAGNNESNNASNGPRVLEEGDIYKAVEGQPGLIINLNRYRGLQVLDLSDVTSPEVIGHVRLSGVPVEMYQVGDQVIVLLNNWHLYQNQYDPSSSHHGGGVVVIDVSDKHNPTITSREVIDGWITTSRLTRGDGEEALFVVSHGLRRGASALTSYVMNDLGALEKKTAITFDDRPRVVYATSDRLLTSLLRLQQPRGSEISLFDISSPDGSVIEGGTITIEDSATSAHGVSIRGDVLRVVSDGLYGSSIARIATYDISDLDAPTLIDQKTTEGDEDLSAALLLDHAAFLTTQSDEGSFYAFEIADDGTITEYPEYVAPHFTHQLTATKQDTRLIGIAGSGSKVEVSLYDVTDLSNTSPLLARSEIDLARSETIWDDRVLTVLEDVTSIPSPDGSVIETSMVLLPFLGWDEAANRYVSAVKIFTFSDSTITPRGMMDHGSLVQRSFMLDPMNATTANISDATLSIFELSSPDAPEPRGQIELSPNYADLMIFGDYGVRHHDRSDFYDWWGARGQSFEKDSLQVVSLVGDIERAPPEAVIEIPAQAQTFRIGDLLTSVSTRYTPGPSGGRTDGQHMSTIDVWDLSVPTLPTLASTLSTTDLGLYGREDSLGWQVSECGTDTLFGRNPHIEVVGDALVVPSYKNASAVEKNLITREVYPKRSLEFGAQGCYRFDAASEEETFNSCEYYEGIYRCSKVVWSDGTEEPEICEGEFKRCEQDTTGKSSCEAIGMSEIETEQREQTRERRRGWLTFSFRAIDTSDPTNVVITDEVAMPTDEEYVGVVAHGSDLYINYKKPVKVEGDPRRYASYWFKRVDMSDPSSPVISAPVSIPGQLIAVDEDSFIVQDFVWGDSIVEAELIRLERVNGQLVSQGAPYRFEDQLISSVVLDEDGDLFVSHSDYNDQDHMMSVSVLSMNDDGWELASQLDVGSRSTLHQAVNDRLVFSVTGGVLVVNVQDRTMPYAQSFFPMTASPNEVAVFGSELFLPAGRHGLYRHDIEDTNLVPLPE